MEREECSKHFYIKGQQIYHFAHLNISGIMLKIFVHSNNDSQVKRFKTKRKTKCSTVLR